jgi:hypothetical protein
VYKWKELWMKYWLEGVKTPTNEALIWAKTILERHIKNVFIRK